METLPSYTQDRKHFLQLLEPLPPMPENVILVTADVTSLFTKIPHEEGMQSLLHYMKLHADTLPPGAPSPHIIGIILATILKSNNLSFMDKHFLQLVGTTMGIKAVPPYANLFMGHHEETIHEAFIWAILFWKRFIDDIFLIFLDTTNQLQTLQDLMNHLHPAIKFTFQHSTHQISFLDMKIHIRADRKLSTILYHSISLYHCITISLLTRKYPLDIITHNISKSLLHYRETLLHESPKASSPRTVLPIVTPVSARPLAYHSK